MPPRGEVALSLSYVPAAGYDRWAMHMLLDVDE